jgi:hypothetical protein
MSSRFSTTYEPITGDIEMDMIFVRPFDAGVYQCKARNKYGSDETVSNIEIVNVPNIDEKPQTMNPDAYKNLEQPFNEPYKPEEKKEEKGKPPKFIIHMPAEVKLHDGVRFKTRCKIEGYPLPKVCLICSKELYLLKMIVTI